jgi:hypothetical protein
MKMDHVNIGLFNNLAKRFGLKQGRTRELRGERREKSPGALKPVQMKTLWRFVGPQRVVATDGLKRIGAMNDVHFMPTPKERPRQPIDIGRIAAETLRAEERGYHADLQERPPDWPSGVFFSIFSH